MSRSRPRVVQVAGGPEPRVGPRCRRRELGVEEIVVGVGDGVEVAVDRLGFRQRSSRRPSTHRARPGHRRPAPAVGSARERAWPGVASGAIASSRSYRLSARASARRFERLEGRRRTAGPGSAEVMSDQEGGVRRSPRLGCTVMSTPSTQRKCAHCDDGRGEAGQATIMRRLGTRSTPGPTPMSGCRHRLPPRQAQSPCATTSVNPVAGLPTSSR